MSNDPYSAPSSLAVPAPKSHKTGFFEKVVYAGVVIVTLLVWYFPLLLEAGKHGLNLMVMLHATIFVYSLGDDPELPTFEQNHFAFWIAEATFIALLSSQIRWRSLLLAIVILVGAIVWIVFNGWLQITLYPIRSN